MIIFYIKGFKLFALIFLFFIFIDKSKYNESLEDKINTCYFLEDTVRADSKSFQCSDCSLSSIPASWGLFLWPQLCTLNFSIVLSSLHQDPINIATALNFIYILEQNSLGQKSMGIILDRGLLVIVFTLCHIVVT